MTEQQIEARLEHLKLQYARDELSELDLENNIQMVLAAYDSPDFGKPDTSGFWATLDPEIRTRFGLDQPRPPRHQPTAVF